MANTIIGKVLHISQAVNVSKTQNPFMKRELVLDASRFDEYTGEKRENFPSFTFTSRNCEKLDGFKVGDLVEVSFILQGRAYEKEGQKRFITDVVGYKVEYYQKSGQSGTMQAQPMAAPQAPMIPPQPSMIPTNPNPSYNEMPF